ncbi:MAG: hypothetical protein LBQ94_09100 [Treponema sp.]|jgi:hypothetical protein|nr:hypothetical protein [Treponema sp.]
MRRIKAFLFFVVLLCYISSFGLQAQSTAGSTEFDMTGFPLWAKDLRRGEIVAFGSFPFAYFFANFGFDTYRFFTHGYDRRFAPWPFAPAASVEQTQSEKFLTLGIAAGGAIVIALVDYAIVRYKRNREQGELKNLPDGTPIIIRRPLYEDEDDTPNGGN